MQVRKAGVGKKHADCNMEELTAVLPPADTEVGADEGNTADLQK